MRRMKLWKIQLQKIKNTNRNKPNANQCFNFSKVGLFSVSEIFRRGWNERLYWQISIEAKLLGDNAGERSCRTFCSKGSTTNKVEKNATEIFFLDQDGAAKWPATIFCLTIVDVTSDEHKGKKGAVKKSETNVFDLDGAPVANVSMGVKSLNFISLF